MNRSRLAHIAGLLFLGCALSPSPGASPDSGGWAAAGCDPLRAFPAGERRDDAAESAGRGPADAVRNHRDLESRSGPDSGHAVALRDSGTTPHDVQAGTTPQVLHRAGRTDLELGVMLPDQARYPVRARLVVRLADGKTISQTAARWVGISERGSSGRNDRPHGRSPTAPASACTAGKRSRREDEHPGPSGSTSLPPAGC